MQGSFGVRVASNNGQDAPAGEADQTIGHLLYHHVLYAGQLAQAVVEGGLQGYVHGRADKAIHNAEADGASEGSNDSADDVHHG